MFFSLKMKESHSRYCHRYRPIMVYGAEESGYTYDFTENFRYQLEITCLQ